MPEIILPKNPEVKKDLLKKRKEYFGRRKNLRRKLKEDEFMHPEKRVRYIVNSNTNYKIRVINELLKNGVVNSEELSLEITKKYGIDFFNEPEFDNACGVIQAYCYHETTDLNKLTDAGVEIHRT